MLVKKEEEEFLSFNQAEQRLDVIIVLSEGTTRERGVELLMSFLWTSFL